MPFACRDALAVASELARQMDEEASGVGKRHYTVVEIAAEFGVTCPIYRHLSAG